MIQNTTVKEYIESIIMSSGFAVLATEGNGQPHVSLIAITPPGNCRELLFATYRNSIKYRNIKCNNKVALLFENKDISEKEIKERVVLTIIGYTEEINISANDEAYLAHLRRHPGMESFMLSPDCTLIKIIAQSYQVVKGIDDIRWITAENLDII